MMKSRHGFLRHARRTHPIRRSSILRSGIRLVAGALTLSLAVGMSISTSGAASSTHAKRGGTLTVELNGTTWPTLDPSVAALQVTSGQSLLAAIYGSLFETSPTGQLLPDLATGSHVSKDGLTVVLYLRHKVKFQDGTPFNSQAVAFTLDRDRNPTNACTCLSYLTDIASIGTPDPYTVVFHMSQAYAPLLIAFATTAAAYMESPTAFAADGEAGFGLHPVGAGPFAVVSNSPNASLVLTRFSGYWNKPEPYLNGITMNYINNSTTGDETVQSGAAQLDIGGGTTPQTAKLARTQSGIVLTRPPSNGQYFVHFNTNTSPFDNPLAREAVAYATNESTINKAVFLGLDQVVDAQSAPGTAFYPSHKLSSYHAYDPTKAAALVKQIGGLSFSIICIPCTYGYLTQAEALQQMWSAVGINASVVNLAEPQAVARLDSGNFQTTMSSWAAFDPAIELGLFDATTGTLNHGQEDSVLNNLMQEAAGTTNATKRTSLYTQIYNRINSEVYNLPTVTASVYDIFSNKLHGIGDNVNIYFENAWLS